MRYILASIPFLALFGCTSYPVEKEAHTGAPLCLGSSELPAKLKNEFEPIDDRQLLEEALGNPKKGKLCQGRAYKSRKDSQVILFRAWNSTNPNSKFGKWWSFQKPEGKISDYRSEYEICYQWSPLDKLVRCTLKPEKNIVFGTGQSVECSKHLTYPVSDKQQIFIANAAMAFTNCAVFDGEFSWK